MKRETIMRLLNSPSIDDNLLGLTFALSVVKSIKEFESMITESNFLEGEYYFYPKTKFYFKWEGCKYKTSLFGSLERTQVPNESLDFLGYKYISI